MADRPGDGGADAPAAVAGRTRAMRKLGLHHRAELVRLALPGGPPAGE